MSKYPTIETERLILRKFKLRDATEMQVVLNNKKIAQTSTSIPHPYTITMAESFINRQEGYFQRGLCMNMAVILKSEDRYIGAIGFNEIFKKHNRALLGYYFDENEWGKGYGSEAVRAMIDYGFNVFKFHKICSDVILPNPASVRILEKMGMKLEGTFQDHVKIFEEYRDVAWYGLINAKSSIKF